MVIAWINRDFVITSHFYFTLLYPELLVKYSQWALAKVDRLHAFFKSGVTSIWWPGCWRTLQKKICRVVPTNPKGVLKSQAYTLSIRKVLCKRYFFWKYCLENMLSDGKWNWHDTVHKGNPQLWIYKPHHLGAQRQHSKVYALCNAWNFRARIPLKYHISYWLMC